MSRIALDGITLAVAEWPGPREADTHTHAIEEDVANLQRKRPGSNHDTVLLGEAPEVKSALRAFLAGASATSAAVAGRRWVSRYAEARYGGSGL
jgi:hypothetical protein